MNPIKFADLLQRYRAGDCTDEEKELIEGWYTSRLQQPYLSLSETEEAQIGESIKSRIEKELEPIEKPHYTIPSWRRYRNWSVAAASLLVLATATYLALRKPQENKRAAITAKAAAPVVPGGNKALLTLADGTVIVLDSAANGRLTRQGATTIVKTQDGQLVYDANSKEPVVADASEPMRWNTISTPRGGQYQVVLPDGSRVWLNAASSLRFPAVFARNERRVELTGEAYFEVAGLSLPDAGKKIPFVVEVFQGGNHLTRGRIEVLGTHFNVMAYQDEHTINTTLLEGRVVFHSGADARVLTPGQQTRLHTNGVMDLVKEADVDEAIAWKNGLFQFNNADIQTVMRQVARWYDVAIEYEAGMPAETFVGEIPRNSDIEEVLKMLELSNVHFRVEGKKITVLP